MQQPLSKSDSIIKRDFIYCSSTHNMLYLVSSRTIIMTRRNEARPRINLSGSTCCSVAWACNTLHKVGHSDTLDKVQLSGA
jgi:hypothetical protein